MLLVRLEVEITHVMLLSRSGPSTDALRFSANFGGAAADTNFGVLASNLKPAFRIGGKLYLRAENGLLVFFFLPTGVLAIESEMPNRGFFCILF